MDAQPSLPVQAVIAASLTATGHVPWKYSRFYRSIEASRVASGVRRIMPAAVLELADIVVPTKFPTFCYQDMNFAVALENFEEFGPEMISTIPTSQGILRRLAEEQRNTLHEVDGIFAMGAWYRDFLVGKMGIARERVHAIGAGLPGIYRGLERRRLKHPRSRNRLIFIGTDFRRKGGDILLDAVKLLNAGGDRPLSLTIVGPSEWPLNSAQPSWVDFCGFQPQPSIIKLLQEHDLFVMPSRFEAYGKVFLEARATGIPCIGRDAYSMPELIEPGVGGTVWSGNDAASLAEQISDALGNDDLYERCASEAAKVAERYSWENVARRILSVIGQHAQIEG